MNEFHFILHPSDIALRRRCEYILEKPCDDFARCTRARSTPAQTSSRTSRSPFHRSRFLFGTINDLAAHEGESLCQYPLPRRGRRSRRSCPARRLRRSSRRTRAGSRPLTRAPPTSSSLTAPKESGSRTVRGTYF